jgi:hypothetical protein
MPVGIDYEQRALIKDAFNEGYELGFRAGQRGQQAVQRMARSTMRDKPKRKLSAWNKYVKANSKKPRFRYRNGKLNLKKMAVAFRKTRKRGGKR